MTDCIFCKIVSGTLPAVKIFEDESSVAILDLFPASKGHTLLIPKKHYENIFDSDENSNFFVYNQLKKLSLALKSGLECDGINIIQNNSRASGQVIFHSHIHLIPRWDGDNLFLPIEGKIKPSLDELEQVAKLIKVSLHQI